MKNMMAGGIIIGLIFIACGRKDDLMIGIDALSKGQYAQAVKSLKAAAASNPSNAEIHYGLCLAYAHLDSSREAFSSYLKIRELDAKLAEDLALKAVVAGLLKLEPFPSSPIAMKKIKNQFKGSPAPGNELIAVAAARVDAAEIYLAKYDGTVVKKVSAGGMNTDPDFSPAGDKIVYVSNKDGDDELYLYDLPTGKTEQLTSNGYQDYAPSFSPDGREIAYVSDMDQTWEIYKINVAQKKITRLTSNQFWDGFPDYTPDGGWIVFSSKRRGSEDIYIMRSNGMEGKVLYATDADETDPHLVGDSLYFRSNRDGEWEIYRLTLKNRLLMRITNNRVMDWNPRISPDGRRLILSRKMNKGWQLFFVNFSDAIAGEILAAAINERLAPDSTVKPASRK